MRRLDQMRVHVYPESAMEMPTQKRDPLKAAAAAYCQIRHKDSGAEACRAEGECFFCQDVVAAVIRAYLNEAHT